MPGRRSLVRLEGGVSMDDFLVHEPRVWDGEYPEEHVGPYCKPEAGCLRVQMVERVIPKNWNSLTLRQKKELQSLINGLSWVNSERRP